VVAEGNTVTSTTIGLPPEMNKWAFDVSIHDTDQNTDVTLDWPGDPIRAGKAVAAVPEGPHDFAFVSFDGGPCLFTRTACLFMYTLSVQADGTADILIQPSALASQGDNSHPFQAFMKGRCTPKAGA
jgi:hypothetical protein